MSEATAGHAVFDVSAQVRELPETSATMVADHRFTDDPAASARVFRVYHPTPPHSHASCDEYLYVLSGRCRMKFGDDLSPPGPLAPDEPERFVLPAALATKAAVYSAWKASGLSKVALAARLDLAEKEVRRILDPDYPTGLARMEQAAQALGIALVVGSRPVPVADAA